MNYLKVFFCSIPVVLGLLLIVFFVFQKPGAVAPKTIQSQGITFEIADTQEKEVQGLSGRTNIPHDYGMLFVFPKEGMYGIWMKDMKEPIDVLWLSGTGEIQGINASVSPDTYPTIFYPPVPVRYVLEMKAGEAELKGFTIGSKITLPE